jgi:5-methylcytosine-specific restriction endonuclease McrA
MYACSQCEKQFDSFSKLGGHVSGHSRRNKIRVVKKINHICEICELSFENGRILAGHIRAHKTIFEDIRKDSTRKSFILRTTKHQCQICNLESWQDKPIPLELDHIDGNSSNNSRDNLRIICPNCHAQTDTYRGKNMGKNPDKKRASTLKKYYGLYR